MSDGNLTDLARRAPDHLYQSLSVVITIIGWEIVSGYLGLLNPQIVPPPSEIAVQAVVLLGSGQLLAHIQITLIRTLVSSSLAIIFGVVIGVAIGWNDRLKQLILPFMSAIYPLPVIAILPLVMLILGKGERAFIFTATLGSFFLIVWNAMNGVEGIDNVYFEVAQDNNVDSRFKLFREVLLPGALPLIFTGLRLGISTALVIIIAVEFVAASDGLGYFIWISWSTYSLANMYSGLFILAFFGIVITYGLQYLGDVVIPWREEIAQ